MIKQSCCIFGIALALAVHGACASDAVRAVQLDQVFLRLLLAAQTAKFDAKQRRVVDHPV